MHTVLCDMCFRYYSRSWEGVGLIVHIHLFEIMFEDFAILSVILLNCILKTDTFVIFVKFDIEF